MKSLWRIGSEGSANTNWAWKVAIFVETLEQNEAVYESGEAGLHTI
jgi:hypothetical protein